MTVYSNLEMSNDAYHAETEHINGSGLWEIYNDCPAKWRYGERKEKKCFTFGTGGHTLLLEPVKFADEYVRMPSVDDYPLDNNGNKTILVTVSDMNSWAKERGIKGLSGKSKSEVIKIIRATGEDVRIYEEERLITEINNIGKLFLEANDYDNIQQMRAVIHANSYHSKFIEGAQSEVSIFNTLLGEPSKVRIDCLTLGSDILDYKTTTSAKPGDFFRECVKYGYFMKMAMQHDIFVCEFGERPRSVNLLPQEKNSPFIPERFRLTDEQLAIGRIQLCSAMGIFKSCKNANSWPSYSMGNPVIEMETPEWFKKQFNL